jgi:hypothetical protein
MYIHNVSSFSWYIQWFVVMYRLQQDLTDRGLGVPGMELSSSLGDSNQTQVHVCIPMYVGRVTWSHT